MPFQHTKTELSVLAKKEATATASIDIGMSAMTPTGMSEEDRYAEWVSDCVADAVAIYELLNRHLPEETRSHLATLYRNEVT